LKKNGAQVCFVARSLPSYLSQMLQDRNINLYPLQEGGSAEELDDLPHSKWLKMSQHEDAMQMLEVLGSNKFEWLIVDHYAIDCRWESLLRGVANKIMVIDDLADRQHDCDVLLDQNYYHDMNDRYVEKVPGHCRLLLGPTYALLRNEFREVRESVKKRDGTITNVMVFFGGMDSMNTTGLVIKVLESINLPISVDVVIGSEHPDLYGIKNSCEINNFTCHIQTREMAKIMNEADLAISAGGSANWERCCLGLPSIIIATALNQVKLSRELADLKVCQFIGDVNDISILDIGRSLCKLYGEKDKLIEFSKNGMELVDGWGAFKVIESMEL
jgi:UDP-2,4-diacetamido-2,4,6-trideoxy-beta-L-altropyranose hydrolase